MCLLKIYTETMISKKIIDKQSNYKSTLTNFSATNAYFCIKPFRCRMSLNPKSMGKIQM